MILKNGHIYHIYNQGNNKGQVFFTHGNYLFFLQKIRTHLLPFTDILAWCLMPNHFHLMVYVKNVDAPSGAQGVAPNLGTQGATLKGTQGVTPILGTNGATTNLGTQGVTPMLGTHGATSNLGAQGVTPSHPLSNPPTPTLSHPLSNPSNPSTSSHSLNSTKALNTSIGIMLRSYTRAINKQENRSGSLFRAETKAICLNEIRGVAPSWFKSAGITYFNIVLPEREYPRVCFNYIHQNPVNAALVNSPAAWEFSSFNDIYGTRNGELINHERILEFGLP